MKKLELNQMGKIAGSCSSSEDKAIAVIGMIATLGSFFGPVGWIIAGPDALLAGGAGLLCAFE
ncbi:MAG TPA: hypothetical protein ENI76_00725 [Ignavibacteria bacterium]|nr:hypothetical protein [Ignavibacteria bacterium]